ncbi:MAG: hypothetical protein U9P72_00760 [Campylobacterota bacterium]|nr:hypothetical protein [Campylobacterota bacterium]
MFGNLFGTKEVVNGGINLIDNAFYTDQEKANMKVKLLKAYEPFKIAQRYLAFMFTGSFIIAFLLCLLFYSFNIEYKGILEIIETFNIDMIVVTIIGFYFGGGMLESLKKRKTDD